MNRSQLEMLSRLETPADPTGNGTVMRWEREQLQRLSESESGLFPIPAQAQLVQGLDRSNPGPDEFVARAVSSGLGNRWPGFGKLGGDSSGFGFRNRTAVQTSRAISRTASCPPAAADTERGGSILQEKLSCKVGKESFKKRKPDKSQCLKVETEDHDIKHKKIRGCGEDGESKITKHNSNKKNAAAAAAAAKETFGDASKENSIVHKPDYIHVRARRGQATDSHSLAERARREKISERMKYLQDLVPGCNKITGKAGMLDEIINYVQSLQRQVEFLSMKLAAIIPGNPDFSIDTSFPKQVIPACGSSFPTTGVSSEIANHAYVQFNPTQELVSCCGSEMVIDPPEMAFRRTISAPVSTPETFLYSTCFNPSPAWDADLQNFYGVEFRQGRSASLFPSQQFTGLVEANNLKMEM